MDEEKIIEERKNKLVGFLKKRQFWTILGLVIILILGAYLRSLPMQDHGNAIPSLSQFITGKSFEGTPGLWDVAKNDWTLGPDLDPWLFTRYAREMIEKSSLPEIDMMRNVPLGFRASSELQMVAYMIVITYKITNMFGVYNLIFAAALMPVLLFLLTIVAFFLFVREIFRSEEESSKTRANIIALVSTLFMTVIPAFLSRTVAGIPEKEAVGFFFMFAAFYFLLKSWKSKKLMNSFIFSVLSGIATALMGLTWGGVSYIYTTVSISTLIAFLINKINKKETILYASWVITSFTIPLLFSTRYSIMSFITSLDTGFASAILFIIIFHFFLWNTKIKNILGKVNFFNETKIPRNIISLIIGIIVIILLIITILGPEFIINKINGLNKTLLSPTTGRWSLTVAENRQPYFREWANEFGPTLANLPNVPIMFWLFFIGSVVLFKKLLNKLNKKHAWILTGLYVLFFFGLVFSRYAPHPAFFDGEDFISKLFYFGSALLFIGFIIYYYIKYEKSKNKGFEEIGYEYILLFSLFALCLFTARSAVRLIMVLGPVAPIFSSYLIVELVDIFRKTKDETWKIIFGAFMILVLIAGIFCFYSYYQSIKSQSYNFVPSYYNQQWQKAMKWVREETPKTAIFAHWWDYGYWVQSIGERATVTDGGNAITFWNYWTGRLVLTGDNQNDALGFLYNHNATHLLVDSSDIGKYGAFSSIGSDKNYDRYSWIGTFLIDERQTEETKNETRYAYLGGIALDENLIINENDKEVLLPGQKTGVGAVILPLIKNGSQTGFSQPYAIMVYNGVNHKVNLRYLSIGEKFLDFKSGIESAAFVFPQIIPNNQGGVSKNDIGAIMFISPRLLRGYLAQKYILNDPFNKFPNFKVVHKEESIIVNSLKSQGMDVSDFIYFQGVQGPITIWKIEYTGKEKVDLKYIDKDASKYIDWEL